MAVAAVAVRGASVIARHHDDHGTASDAVALPPHAPTAMLVERGSSGNAVSLMLLSVPTRGAGGHILLMPPGAMTEIPSFGLDALGHTLTLGGPGLLQATVENLLGVTVDQVVVADDAALVSMVRSAGPFAVRIPERVEQVATDQRVVVLWEPGQTQVRPDQVPSLLTVRGRGNDLGRLARQQAFWEGWLARLREQPSSVPTGGADLGLGRFIRSLVGGQEEVDTLPVEAVDAGGAGEEVYRVRPEDVEALMAQIMPDAVTRSRARPRVQVLNGTGEVRLAPRVTLRLVQPPTRARVVYTGNADDFSHDVTEVVFYDRRQQGVAEQVRRALGVGRLVLSRRPLDVVDVTVVVGRDFGHG